MSISVWIKINDLITKAIDFKVSPGSPCPIPSVLSVSFLSFPENQDQNETFNCFGQSKASKLLFFVY